VISFQDGSHRFQYRVAAIVMDSGQLLVHRVSGDAFWTLPGGRVNVGESAQAALCREFEEELGTSIECGHLACVGENFFRHDQASHHEIGLYFYAGLPADSSYNDKRMTFKGVETNRQLEFKWFETQQLHHVDMRPQVARDGLATMTLPHHFVQHL
jgi:ADP-ribose pyrophosphatase YjhB (NUDIX family)